MVESSENEISLVQVDANLVTIDGGVSYPAKWDAGEVDRLEAGAFVMAELPDSTAPNALQSHGASCLRLWGQINGQMVWHQEAYTKAKVLATFLVMDKFKALGPTDRRPLVDGALAEIKAQGDRLKMLAENLEQRVMWCKKMISHIEAELRAH